MKNGRNNMSSWATFVIGSACGVASIGFGIWMGHTTLTFDEGIVQNVFGGTGHGILYSTGLIGLGLISLVVAWISFPPRNRKRISNKPEEGKCGSGSGERRSP